MWPNAKVWFIGLLEITIKYFLDDINHFENTVLLHSINAFLVFFSYCFRSKSAMTATSNMQQDIFSISLFLL